MKKVAILFGGVSAEYEVSLKSAAAIIETLAFTEYEVVKIGITEAGSWYLVEGTVDEIRNDTWLSAEMCKEVAVDFDQKGFVLTDSGQLLKVDTLFPVLHGGYGENGAMQGLLEMMDIPYVGCGVAASAISMNKRMLHQFAETLGIKSTPSITIQNEKDRAKLESFIEVHGFPIYIKPNEAGSSKGISKVNERSELSQALREAAKYDSQLLIQKEVKGIEIGCGILGNEELIIGECDQISLVDGFFDYEEKYNLVTAEIILPAKIPLTTKKKIQDYAQKLYLSLGCTGLARIDFFLTEDGAILLNEINTMPGFTAHSRFPMMMKEIGLDYKEMIKKLLTLAVENHEKKLSKACK